MIRGHPTQPGLHRRPMPAPHVVDIMASYRLICRLTLPSTPPRVRAMPPRISSVRRREFLAAGAASVPLFVSGRALGADGDPPASERVGFAVMGLGDRGPGHCGMGKSAQLIAVCDPWKNRREKIAAARKCDAYADHREALTFVSDAKRGASTRRFRRPRRNSRRCRTIRTPAWQLVVGIASPAAIGTTV